MIRPGASPLFEPVRIAMPPLGCPDDVADELWAWLRSHGVGQWDLTRGIVIDQHRLALTFDTMPPALPGFTLNVQGPPPVAGFGYPDHPAPQRATVHASKPLLSHPGLRMLVVLARTGNLICTATRDHDACNVRVDSRGRHPGSHADGRHGDGVWWPNDNEGTAEIPIAAEPARPDSKVHVREPFADFLDRLLVDNTRTGIVSSAPSNTPARPITKADINAAITRLTRLARRQVYQYTPPVPSPIPSDAPMIIAFDPAHPDRFDVWQADENGGFQRVEGGNHATE